MFVFRAPDALRLQTSCLRLEGKLDREVGDFSQVVAGIEPRVSNYLSKGVLKKNRMQISRSEKNRPYINRIK